MLIDDDDGTGKPRDRKTILEDNIEEIVVQPTEEAPLKANPAGGYCPYRVMCFYMVPQIGLAPHPHTTSGH